MILNSIGLVTSDLEDSVDFYTRTLGLKEIERDSDGVSLQGSEIGGSLKLWSQESVDMDAGSVVIAFTVNDLASIVYKLKNLGVDVELENNDDGTQETGFLGPNDEIYLTTAAPSEMSDSEEIETRIDGISIITDDVGDSVSFFKVLGLKEIEGWTYEDDEDNVGLQAGDIIVELSSRRWLESEGVDRIDFTVNNLNHSVQKLKAAGVDVDVRDINEHWGLWVSFKDPDNIWIGLRGGLRGLVQVPDEETDAPSDGNAERPSIGEKVRFWEEQDKINQALIPRVREMHDIVTDLHNRTANITGQIAAAEARVLQNVKEQVQSLVKEAEARVLQNVKEQVQSLVKEAETRVLQNVKEQVQSLVKEAEARVLQNVKEQVQSLVKEAEARVLQNVKEQVQSLVKEAETRVLQQVNDQLPNLVQREVSQALSTIRRIAYTAVVLAALALALILYLVVS